MQVLLSWSGGKDAAWTLHVLRQRDDVEVVGLVTTITEGFERVAMQGIRLEVLHAQAHATGLPVIEARMPQQASDAVYASAFAAALARARACWPGLRHIAFGDLFLEDIRLWRAALCARLGWTPMFPLFGSDTAALARAMLAGGLRAMRLRPCIPRRVAARGRPLRRERRVPHLRLGRADVRAAACRRARRGAAEG